MGLIQSDASVTYKMIKHIEEHMESRVVKIEMQKKRVFKTEILISQSTYTNLSHERQVMCLELFSRFT